MASAAIAPKAHYKPPTFAPFRLTRARATTARGHLVPGSWSSQPIKGRFQDSPLTLRVPELAWDTLLPAQASLLQDRTSSRVQNTITLVFSLSSASESFGLEVCAPKSVRAALAHIMYRAQQNPRASFRRAVWVLDSCSETRTWSSSTVRKPTAPLAPGFHVLHLQFSRDTLVVACDGTIVATWACPAAAFPVLRLLKASDCGTWACSTTVTAVAVENSVPVDTTSRAVSSGNSTKGATKGYARTARPAHPVRGPPVHVDLVGPYRAGEPSPTPVLGAPAVHDALVALAKSFGATAVHVQPAAPVPLAVLSFADRDTATAFLAAWNLPIDTLGLHPACALHGVLFTGQRVRTSKLPTSPQCRVWTL